VIATCLLSSQTMTSSFVLMPTSSSRVSINRQLNGKNGRVRPLSNALATSVWNKSTLTQLTAVRPSGRSDTSTTNERYTSQMTLPQILELLNRLNIRYPPDAARSELEELLHQSYKSSQQEVASQSTTTSPSSSTSPVQSGPNIVDAVVLDDDNSVNDEEYYQRDQTERENAHHRHSSQSHHNRRKRQGRTTSRSNNRSSDGDSTYRAEYRTKSNQYRPRRRRENYDLYNNYNLTTSSRARRRKDVIDLDTFDLPDEPNNRNGYYDNGAQIFLMGFLEAGKTAAQLAFGSVAEAVNPFSEEKRWYDEERGREVLDVNILDYSPDYEQRSQRRYSGETGRARRRRRRRPVRPGRNYRDVDSVASDRPSRRRRSIEKQPASNVSRNPMRNSLEQPNSFPVARGSSSSRKIGSDSVDTSTTQVTAIKQDQPRNERSRHDGTKPMYGLYNTNTDIDDQSKPDRLYNTTQQRQEPQLHSKKHTHPKKIWKKRLRKKFDAALGLQSPSSPSSAESLYNSWKTQVGGVHDGRKEALRTEMNKKESSAGPSRNNRRSRMRAKLNSSQVGETAKSYLDEPPFWRKDGTIASVLFDSQQPTFSSRRERDMQLKRRYNNSLDTLEALLRSPLGRQNTVSSLVIFIARSSLSWFGSLCRWAGVRGTIPQPIVVTTVFAMGISSRRGYRSFSLCLSLLALRMVGEFLHSSLHGNEFWEDDYNKEKHEWTQE